MSNPICVNCKHPLSYHKRLSVRVGETTSGVIGLPIHETLIICPTAVFQDE